MAKMSNWQFVKGKILLGILLIFILACSKTESPKLWVWAGFNENYSDNQWDSVFQKMEEHKIYGILLNANVPQLEKVIPLAQKHDIQVHAWMWTMVNPAAPKDWLCVNALGYSLADSLAYVEYYKFMSPALPQVHQYIQEKVENLAKVKGISGVHLDYIRYVDCILPKEIQSKYGLKQDSVSLRYDYDYHPIMRDAYQAIYKIDPCSLPDKTTNQQWIQFRMDKITELVNSLSSFTQAQNVKISAAVFPSPEMARNMVRQDWAKWKLDYFFPMIYHNFYGENVEWIGKIVAEDVKAVPDSKVICGLFLPGFKNTQELKSAIEIAMKNGAAGVSFFDLSVLRESDWKMIKELN